MAGGLSIVTRDLRRPLDEARWGALLRHSQLSRPWTISRATHSRRRPNLSRFRDGPSSAKAATAAPALNVGRVAVRAARTATASSMRAPGRSTPKRRDAQVRSANGRRGPPLRRPLRQQAPRRVPRRASGNRTGDGRRHRCRATELAAAGRPTVRSPPLRGLCRSERTAQADSASGVACPRPAHPSLTARPGPVPARTRGHARVAGFELEPPVASRAANPVKVRAPLAQPIRAALPQRPGLDGSAENVVIMPGDMEVPHRDVGLVLLALMSVAGLAALGVSCLTG